MKVTFIRHGATKGNLEKRYIGITDEALCLQGKKELIEHLKKQQYPSAEKIIVSPMLRCRETAEIIYHKQEYHIWQDLKECDFGLFENKNYLELSGNMEYQNWIESNGTLAFPNGESIEEFKARCVKGFQECIKEFSGSHIVFIVHGGTIMAIFEKFAIPYKTYYDWSINNGNGYTGEWNQNSIINAKKLH